MKPLANTLTNAIEAVARNVSRHPAVYAAARPNHPALAPYETIADVLAARRAKGANARARVHRMKSIDLEATFRSLSRAIVRAVEQPGSSSGEAIA